MTNQPSVARKNTKSHIRWSMMLGLLAQGAFGALLGFGVARSGVDIIGNLELSWLTIVLLLFGMVLIYHLVLLVHECGHLLGGRLVGFRFLLLIVGPLKLVREQHGIQASFNRSPGLWGGLAGSVPPNDHDLRRRMIAMAAGGPLASLVLALLAGSLAWGVSHQTACPPACASSSATLVWLLLLFTSATSFLIFLVTSTPSRFGGFVSDGARLLMLRQDGPAAERLCAVVAVQAAALAGQRPRAWNSALLERALQFSDASFDEAAAVLLAYAHALDRGEIERAGQLLDRALTMAEALPSAIRPSLLLEAAYFTAQYRKDAPGARAWLHEARGGLVEPPTRARAEAAMLLAEGQHEAAATRAREGLALLRRAWDAGSAQAEAAWLQAILDQAEKR